MKIFTEGQSKNLPEKMTDTFKNQFSDEILRSLFNETRRYDLSLKEEDIVKSKRSD